MAHEGEYLCMRDCWHNRRLFKRGNYYTVEKTGPDPPGHFAFVPPKKKPVKKRGTK